VLDTRLYRAAFVPVIAAVVALMFSVEPVPEPILPGTPPAEFDARGAMTSIREVTELAPSREPGSDGDEAVADYVAERFGEVPAGSASEQVFEASFDGEEVSLRNVLLTLPGEVGRTIVVLASRDSVGGAGGATSAGATGVLLGLADQFGDSRHHHTLIFASLSGGLEGAAGAREIIAALPPPERTDAVIVISQPGAAVHEPPFLIPWSTGPESTSRQLIETADEALLSGVGRRAGLPGAFGELARLAIPSGLGDQAPLVEAGYDAIAISSAGERRLDDAEQLDQETMGMFGRTAYALLVALDAFDGPLEHGPEAQVVISENLLPGWSLGLLALALLLPALIAGVDAMARTIRNGEGLAAVLWVGRVAAPFVATLLLAYLLALIGLIPDPAFPFDPALNEPDAGGIIAVVLLAAVLVGGLVAGRRVRLPSASVEARAAVAGLASTLALAGVWLLNPFLALIGFGFAHVWTLSARPAEPPHPALVALLVAVAAIPLALALTTVSSALELGAGAPWHLLLMTTGGHFSPLLALAASVVAGCSAALVAMSWRPRFRLEALGSG
jgi:hypothetical protein